MGRLIFISIFLKSHFLFSQGEIINISLLDPYANIIYRNTGTKIIVKGYEQDSTIKLVTTNDTLLKIGDYFHYNSSFASIDTLKAIMNGKIIAQKTYSIENLRKPKIHLGSIRDSLVTIKDILNNSQLIVSYEPQIAVPCMRLLHFDGLILKKSGKKIPLTKENGIWTGNTLNTYQLKHIKRMKPGDVLHFQNGILSCPSCINTRTIINLRFTIKQN